jgi:lipoprotein-releasing system ATP-binding protein
MSEGTYEREPASAGGSAPASARPRVSAPILQAEGLVKHYPTADGALEVLSGLDLTVSPGEMVAVVGESGTGKSTLLHLLGALDRPTAGRVLFRGEDVFAQKDEALAAFRNRAIGFVFQFHHLLPEFTALENVAMPALIAGQGMEAARPRAAALLALLGLSARADHRPNQLSGGEQQRVAVARALMNRPGLVLADEPTGNLDTRTAEVLHEELRRLASLHEQAFVVVTHNPALAALADRVLELRDGRLHDVTAERKAAAGTDA